MLFLGHIKKQFYRVVVQSLFREDTNQGLDQKSSLLQKSARWRIEKKGLGSVRNSSAECR
jgi:hypothetical protein